MYIYNYGLLNTSIKDSFVFMIALQYHYFYKSQHNALEKIYIMYNI